MASEAMGVDTLTSITYSGMARNGQFGQSTAIGNPMGPNNLTQITEYTRTITFETPADTASLVSRATGPTQPPTVPGVPAPEPGVFNQNVSAEQAGTNWNQGLNVWTTPWGFLKGAVANAATVEASGDGFTVSFSPAGLTSPSGQPYVVTGMLDANLLVTHVETEVEHNVLGNLLVEFDYSGYADMGGVQVPGQIVQRQGGLQTFDATITSATPNPVDVIALLTPPPNPGRGGGPGGGGPGGAPAAPPVEMLGEGVYKIGGNYTSLAIDMGDHILVVESGQSDARGMAVMAAAKEAIPGKPITQVVNSHPHFDHASGLAAAVAEGATILTHENNEPVLERFLTGSRTLANDSLAQLGATRTDVVQAVPDQQTLTGTNGKVVELHHLPNEHTDGMLGVYLPAERVLWTADVTVINSSPAQVGVVRWNVMMKRAMPITGPLIWPRKKPALTTTWA
jgi:glyoxylase-like metal-dependent hydrolase (beta-lactamase superfamily II)